MALYLETNTDGFNEEGIGSVVQWNIFLYGICKKLNVNFYAKPFSNIAHYQYNNTTKEKWSEDFTKFFNFNSKKEFDSTYDFFGSYLELKKFIQFNKHKNISIKIKKEFIANNWFSFINEFYEKRYLEDIKNNLVYPNNTYFHKDFFNISIHLRTLNSCDIPTYPFMETYLVYTNESHIKNIFNILKQRLCDKNIRVYIHSQGNPENFNNLLEFNEDNFEVILKLNDHPINDIYHMSNSDLLIISKSSYSWFSHLLNFNQTMVRDDFFQPMYPNRILLNSEYKFDPTELKL